MSEDLDLQRVRTEYANRARRFAASDAYTSFNLATLFILQQRQRLALNLLRRHGYFPLAGHRILELGCGSGRVLDEFLSFGSSPDLLHGADLLFDRLEQAHSFLPNVQLTNSEGQNLPYKDNSFDLVIQYTVLSSILDDKVRAHITSELMRVLDRARGMILWYDFWLNPTNRQTRGIKPAEIRRLFPGCRVELYRTTLAPPISRRLVHISWVLCHILENIRLFNSHYMAIIKFDIAAR
jgi:SAM-dependent methyltransferase